VLWNGSWRKSLALLAVGLVLGLLLSFQWKAEPSVRLTDTSYGRDRTVLTIARLEEEQDALKEQLAGLRSALDAKQQNSAQSAELLQDLSNELQSQRALAGLTPVHGPGVEVVLNDSTRPVVPSEVNTEFYLVHDYDLRDVINLLWAVGAEAIAVNNERIVTTTSIYCVGATIMVNDTRMSPPYVIRAIGPADQQESILKSADFLADLKSRVSRYRLEFKVTRSESVTVPAYQGSFGVTHASASE
jgi:uncharacterized protein YlxW (UPF0749 family)